MSVLIKSNNVLNNAGFGQVKMLGTTAQAQFDAYKARVLADGGTIKDEARTLSAFNLLFNNKMYGNMNTAVSGTFGVKLDSNGGITKLYAIDGVDLVGVTYGTGALPKLGANNNIDFSANSRTDAVNGGMLTTAQKIIPSRAGIFGVMLKIEAFTESASQRIAGLTKHNDVANTQTIAAVSNSSNGELAFSIQSGSLNLTSTPTLLTPKFYLVDAGFLASSFITIPDDNKVYGIRGSSTVASAIEGKSFAINNDDFYIDLGGEYHSDRKYFGRHIVRDFFCFAHATQKQAMALNAFS